MSVGTYQNSYAGCPVARVGNGDIIVEPDGTGQTIRNRMLQRQSTSRMFRATSGRAADLGACRECCLHSSIISCTSAYHVRLHNITSGGREHLSIRVSGFSLRILQRFSSLDRQILTPRSLNEMIHSVQKLCCAADAWTRFLTGGFRSGANGDFNAAL